MLEVRSEQELLETIAGCASILEDALDTGDVVGAARPVIVALRCCQDYLEAGTGGEDGRA